MSTASHHVKNISWLALADVFGKTLGFFYFAYLFYTLTKTENEWLTLFLVCAPMIMVLNGLGFHDVINREVSKSKDRVHALVSTAIIAQLAAAVATITAAWFLTGLLEYPRELRLILVVASIVALIWTIASTHFSVIAAHEKFKFTSIINMCTRTIAVAGSIALLYLGFKVLALVTYLLLIYALQAAAAFWVVQRKCGGYTFMPSKREAAYLFREGASMLAGRLAGTAYARVDLPLFRSIESTQAAEGLAIGPRFYMLLTTIPDILETVFFPILSRKAEQGAIAQRDVLERFYKAACILAFPMGVGMTVLGEDIVTTVAGEQYRADALTAIVFTWMVALALLDRPAVVFLRARARQSHLVWGYGAVLILKLVLAFPVINGYGLSGLLVMNLILSPCLTLALALGVPATEKKIALSRIMLLALRPIAASVVMAGALFFLQGYAIYWTVPLGACIYGITLLTLGTLDAEDRALIRSLFG